MTSHNRCTTQRRLILPHSASGGLRQGRFPSLRFGAICCIELCDVMPSPEAGGRSRARPQNIPRCGLVTKALTAASCRLALTRSPPGESHPPGCACAQSSPDAPASRWSVPPCKPPPCQRSPNVCRSMFRCSGSSHRAGKGRSHRASPSGPDHAGCWPGERGRRSFVAVAARSKQVFVGSQGPEQRRALPAAERVDVDALIAARLEIDQEREENAGHLFLAADRIAWRA